MSAQAPEPAGGDLQHAVASIRAELARVRSAVGRIERDLGELEAGDLGPAAIRQRPDRYLRVLVDVYERGGRHGVDVEEWASIGAHRGYDRRGLGGFFTGARAPLRRVEERIVLTMHGEHLVDSYLGSLRA
jgi:hypothetical protein